MQWGVKEGYGPLPTGGRTLSENGLGVPYRGNPACPVLYLKEKWTLGAWNLKDAIDLVGIKRILNGASLGLPRVRDNIFERILTILTDGWMRILWLSYRTYNSCLYCNKMKIFICFRHRKIIQYNDEIIFIVTTSTFLTIILFRLFAKLKPSDG